MKSVLNKTSSFRIAAVTFFVTAGLTYFIYAVFIPKTAIGEIFFGGYEPFYNIKIAEFFYKEAIRHDQKKNLPPPYAHYQLSRVYFIQGDLNRSLEEAHRELEYYPDHVHTNYILGLTLGYMFNREHEAIEAFARFIEYKPDSWAARNDKAWLHFRIGEIKEGLDTIELAVKLYPDNPWVLNTYGTLLMNAGLYEPAYAHLKHGLDIANSMTEAEWGKSYPGNSPTVYDEGLAGMRASFVSNLKTLEERTGKTD